MATADTYPHVILGADGEALIEGTRYTVKHVAAEQYFSAGQLKKFCGSIQICGQPRSMRHLPTSTTTTTPSSLPSKPERHRPNGPATRSHFLAMNCCGVALWQMAAEGNPSHVTGRLHGCACAGRSDRGSSTQVSRCPNGPS
jgi:hypothetical protein